MTPGRAVLLHFVPGVAIAAVYLALSALPLPHVAGLLFAFLFVGIPIQVTLIRRHGIKYNARIPLWQHVAGVVVLIGIEFLLLKVAIPRLSLPPWMPVAFSPAADDDLPNFARAVVLPVLVLQLIVDGIVNPIVEERYFRGLLLPQLERFRLAAPILSTAFFALAHFWQLHNVVSIFVYVLPLTLFTWWRRNYYAQAFVHCFANSLGATMALVALLKGG